MNPLFEHQKVMREHHLSSCNTLDLSDVGTGKTAGVLTAISELVKAGKISRALVIAPNSVLAVWATAIEEWSELTYVVLQGTKKERIEKLQIQAHCYLINYEGLRVVYPQLDAQNWDLILCDEVHHIKSQAAQQSKLVIALAKKARARKGLSGTVLTKSIEDLWAVMQFIDPDCFKTNFWGFRNRYLYDANAGKSWIKWPDWKPRPGAVEEITRRIAPYMIKFTKREVLPWLPPVLFQKRYVELSTEQRRAYDELRDDFITELEKGEELAALQILPRVTKLLEITSGFAYRENEETYRFKHNAKLAELRAVLDDLGDNRVVIWATFREDIAIISKMLDKASHCYIQGDVHIDERKTLIDAFNRGDIQYFVANASCVGEGTTILAPYVIYFSRGWKLGERLQSLGRHDRPGAEQFENVTIIDLIASDTIDARVLKALENKEDLLKTVTAGAVLEMLK